MCARRHSVREYESLCRSVTPQEPLSLEAAQGCLLCLMSVQCIGQDQVQSAQGAEDCDGDDLHHNAPYPQPPSGEDLAWQSTSGSHC